MLFKIKSESQIDEKTKAYRNLLDKDYQQKLEEIVEYVKKNCDINSKEKLSKKVFDWFCDNVKYDENILSEKREDGSFINKEYEYKGGKFWRSEKYALLCGKGVCQSISLALKDVYSMLGIECRYVSGRDDDVVLDRFKGRHHAWNEIVLEGKTYTVDWTPHFRTFMTEPRTKQTNEHCI